MSDTEAHARGINHGWDAANFAAAYGSEESKDDEAARRSREEYRESRLRAWREAYQEGFLLGWQRFTEDRWRDGTPQTDDN